MIKAQIYIQHEDFNWIHVNMVFPQIPQLGSNIRFNQGLVNDQNINIIPEMGDDVVGKITRVDWCTSSKHVGFINNITSVDIHVEVDYLDYIWMMSYAEDIVELHGQVYNRICKYNGEDMRIVGTCLRTGEIIFTSNQSASMEDIILVKP